MNARFFRPKSGSTTPRSGTNNQQNRRPSGPGQAGRGSDRPFNRQRSGGRGSGGRNKGRRSGGGGGRFRGGRDRFVRRPGKPAGPRYRMEIATTQEPMQVPAVGANKLRLFFLGGLETPGERNMAVLEYGDDIITIDCGTWFADSEVLPGVDYVIPNSSYLRENASRIRAMLVCHGHLDHIGGLPHIAPLLNYPPIYCTPLSKALIEKRQEEFGNKDRFKINTFTPRDVIQLGAFKVEIFHINHNIPEAVGFAIHTPNGTIVHSGDFKFDLSPTLGKPSDVGHIAQIGDKGVLALLIDSTDAGYPGHQISETDVQRTLEDVFKDTKGRLIAVTFASLITRVQMLLNLAEKYGRKVVLEGRGMKSYTEIAHQLQVIRIKPGTLIDVREMNNYPDNKVMVIGTGAQAEEFAMLMRIANGEHRSIAIKPGDTVLFSSSVIPGNERGIEALQDSLTRQGAQIIEKSIMDVHAGGHGKNEDLKLMMRLVRPKYLIPIHANFTRRKLCAELAVPVGIPRHNSFVIENGDVLEFDQTGRGDLTKFKVPAGNVLVDGLGEGDISQIVLRDRKELAAEGLLVIIVTTNAHGQMVREPMVISRGFASLQHNAKLGKEIEERVKAILAGVSPNAEVNVDYLNSRIRNELAEFIWGKTERRPMILPIVVRA
ncbi:MAG: ribonuclease J [Candidatus Andersenbacteria bacterium]